MRLTSIRRRTRTRGRPSAKGWQTVSRMTGPSAEPSGLGLPDRLRPVPTPPGSASADSRKGGAWTKTILLGGGGVAGLGLIFYNFPHDDLERFLSFAQQAGFQYCELPCAAVWDERDPEANPERRAAEVHALLERYGMRISALSADNDFVQPDDAGMEFQVQRLKRVCALARLVGTSVLRIDGGGAKDSVPQERWRQCIVSGLRAIRPFIEREGFTLALDNHGMVTNDADFEVGIFQEVGSNRIGANVDTMNYRWAGHDLATVGRFYHVIAPYARHVHLKDGRGSQREYRGTALGEGELDLELAVQELQDAGYQGVYAVEYEGPSAQAEEGYSKGLAWLRAHLKTQ